MKRSVRANFSSIVDEMIRRYDLRVNRWRRTMTGCAWRVHFIDGIAHNYIESPYPRTPISLAIFLHEVGHHVIGFERYKRRCEEEFHAWKWAIDTMRSLKVEPDTKVLRRFDLSMRYAVDKALRRGAVNLPETLSPYLSAA